MDVSIIIPVYNVERYLADCLRSVMAQTARCRIECLLVDDCGQDDSIKIALKAITAYKGPIEFRVIPHTHNRGLSAARNTGIQAARGEYLFFLDSDDHISADCIERLYTLTLRYPGVDVVYGLTVCEPEPDIMSEYFDLKRVTRREFDDYTKRVTATALRLPEIACNRLIRRDWLIYSDLWFKEGIVNEDFHWHLRAYRHIRSCACLLEGEPTYFYLQRPESIIGRQNLSDAARAKAEIMIDIARGPLLWNRAFQVYVLRKLVEIKQQASQAPQLQGIYSELIDALMHNRDISWRSKLVIRYVDSRFFNKYVYYLIRSIT